MKASETLTAMANWFSEPGSHCRNKLSTADGKSHATAILDEVTEARASDETDNAKLRAEVELLREVAKYAEMLRRATRAGDIEHAQACCSDALDALREKETT